jgi:adenylosuccinate lyase
MSNFESVINTRYKAPILSKIWSPTNKIRTMRQLWIDLASIQKEMGIECISDEAIQELITNRDIIDMHKINECESRTNHDIMAHVQVYADMCPAGGKIIHLGATSNFINDNIDAIFVKTSFKIIEQKLCALISSLKRNAEKYSETPTIAYTHLQPAQLITIGRRFSMWLQDFRLDMDKLKKCNVYFRGIKGTVGTEDTLLKLFDNDIEKCNQLNDRLSQRCGFKNYIHVCGQTYSRKYDVEYIHILSCICQSTYKMMNDIRLLSGKMEVYEQFGKEQIGSSAMPYKQNPITCEKICSLCRYVINNEQNMVQTYTNQWLERSLDDSAIKRILFPESFLLMEYILDETLHVIYGVKFDFKHINTQVNNHMINIISEQIILNGVKMGYSRQEIHEKLRCIFTNNNSGYIDITTLKKDNDIENIMNTHNISLDPNDYIGRSVEQSFMENFHS